MNNESKIYKYSKSKNYIAYSLLIRDKSYEITEQGEIKHNGELVRTFCNNSGYLYFSYNGRKLSIHCAIAHKFIPNLNDYPCINHKDGNKQNNVVSNLEWCTYSYNNSYGGKAEYFRKLYGKKVSVDGVIYDSVKQAANKNGISGGRLSYHLNRYNTVIINDKTYKYVD